MIRRQFLVVCTRPAGLFQSAVVLLIFISAIVSANATAADATRQKLLLPLESHEPDVTDGADAGLLVREIMRQAVLIAARDGLALETRDATLREPFPKDAAPVDIRTFADTARFFRIELHRSDGGGSVLNWAKEWNMSPGKYAFKFDEKHYSVMDDANFVEQVEPLSRGEIVDALKRLGFDGAPIRSNPAAQVPDSVEELLRDMSVVAQYEAVRKLHAAMRSTGESPALLGALARGYANLGQLTSYYWNATPKVFWARSMLYAQRMVAESSQSPRALWTRAYARGICGLHAPALDDLAAARRAAEAANSQPPDWVEPLDAYCRYDTGKLAKLGVAGAKFSPLAMFLCFLTVERCGSQSVVIEIGKAALDANPMCLRIMDEMNSAAGVSYGHVLSGMGTQMLGVALEARLGELPGLPEAVRAAIPNRQADAWTAPATQANLASRLIEAGGADDGEPSWAALGRMLQEENFSNVRRRAQFLCNGLGVEVADYLNESAPLIAEHPYRAYLQSLNLKRSDGLGPIQQMLKGMRLTDAEMKMGDMSWRPGWINATRPDGSRPLDDMLKHSDGTAFDERDAYTKARLEGMLGPLRLISPHCPTVIAATIEHNWKSIEAEAENLERVHGSHPTISAALAKKYIELNRPVDAERNLKRYLSRAPDEWAYQSLADIYLNQGDEAKWLATLEESLTKEDYGLSHASVRVSIARHFMSEKQFAKAEPYAAAAAESWAAWAMQCARECYEGLGDWKSAELWMRREVERYENSPFNWYFWCQRTGHGSLPEARNGVEAFLAATNIQNVTGNAAAFYILEGRGREARDLLQSQFQRTSNPWQAVHLALLLDEAGDAAGRDAMLKAAAESPFKRWLPPGQVDADTPAIRQMASDWQSLLALGLNEKTELKEFASHVPGAQSAGDVEYFWGKFLALHGQPAVAEKWWRHCVASPKQFTISRTLSAAALRKLAHGSSPASAK